MRAYTVTYTLYTSAFSPVEAASRALAQVRDTEFLPHAQVRDNYTDLTTDVVVGPWEGSE